MRHVAVNDARGRVGVGGAVVGTDRAGVHIHAPSNAYAVPVHDKCGLRACQRRRPDRGVRLVPWRATTVERQSRYEMQHWYTRHVPTR